MNALQRPRTVSLCLLGISLLALSTASAQSADGYAGMLSYLANTRIDDRALSNSSGVLAVNMAAGDLNLQANLHSIAVGNTASATVRAEQQQRSNAFDPPLHASATLGGQALSGSNGIASINQASGSGNAELNSVVAVLAEQGIRETTEEALASAGSFASAGGRHAAGDGLSSGTRRVGVESSALRGFEGVLQLNQIAGSGNATDNQLSISVQTVP
jgi:hypothetical protein